MAKGNNGGQRPAFGSPARKAQQRAAFAASGGTPTPTPTPSPTVTLSAAISKSEGNSGANLYVYTVTRSSTVGAVSVPWSFTAGGTSADDFTGGVYPAGGSVALANGVASGTITVSVNGDAVVEGNETFTVLISTPAGYVAGASMSATGTILNDDTAPAPVVLPTTPQGDWDARFSTVATSGGRVTSVSDLRGLAAMTEGAAGAGPLVVADDGEGRPCWKFEGAEYLNGATTFGADNRNCTVFVVARMHKGKSNPIFALGNVAAGTAVNTGNAVMRTAVVASGAPFLYGGGISAGTAASNAAYMVPGSQPQVLGMRSALTAGGGQRAYVNRKAAAFAQNTINAAGVLGFEIGRYPFSPGASGTWAQMDVYKVVVYNTALTDAQCDAIATALADYYGIPEVVDQIVVPGDSITDGVGTMKSSENIAMVMTQPGAAWRVPKTTRVVNIALSGNTTDNLVTQRDAASSMLSILLPGTNKLGVQIGRNNIGTALNQTGAQAYAAIVALLHTASTGYLERGWTVYQAINIAVGSSLTAQNDNLRTLLRSSSFLTDCLAGPGQTYDGKLSRIDLPLITVAGSGTIFDTAADSGDALWFQGDATHPTALGTIEMAKAYAAAMAA